MEVYFPASDWTSKKKRLQYLLPHPHLVALAVWRSQRNPAAQKTKKINQTQARHAFTYTPRAICQKRPIIHTHMDSLLARVFPLPYVDWSRFPCSLNSSSSRPSQSSGISRTNKVHLHRNPQHKQCLRNQPDQQSTRYDLPPCDGEKKRERRKALFFDTIMENTAVREPYEYFRGPPKSNI